MLSSRPPRTSGVAVFFADKLRDARSLRIRLETKLARFKTEFWDFWQKESGCVLHSTPSGDSLISDETEPD